MQKINGINYIECLDLKEGLEASQVIKALEMAIKDAPIYVQYLLALEMMVKGKFYKAESGADVVISKLRDKLFSEIEKIQDKDDQTPTQAE